MIKHMFERMAGSGTGGDERVGPVPPAMQDLSESADSSERPASAPCWRETATGPEMIAALAEVALQSCSDEQLLDVLVGWERAAAWLEAQRTRVLARTEARLLDTAVRQDRELTGHVSWTAAHRQVETEISTALRWTSRTTIPRLDRARDLTDRLPHVLDAMSGGQLSYRHAEMICEETDTLTQAQARHLAERIVPEAARTTVEGSRRRLRKACLQLDPDTANERANKAVTERSVTIRPLRDGLMSLTAIGPADAVLAMFRVLGDTADRHTQGDPRTSTARRFDALTAAVLRTDTAFCSLPPPTAASATSAGRASGASAGCSTGSPSGSSAASPSGSSTGGPSGFSAGGAPDCPPPAKIPALIQITMDVPTLLGLQDNPAELPGYGPLPANLARLLAADAHWQRFIQDPLTGAPQDLGRSRRHPDAALRRWIIARDQTCLFPECYRPATDCEPDHNPAWSAGGGTDQDTLSQLCPKHHKVHHHGWTYQRHPDRITWTSPHHRVYERYLREADLIGPDDACPHLDTEHDDSIDPPLDDDQRLDIFLPNRRPGQRPDEEIPWDIVQAFRLDDLDTWPLDTWPLDTWPLDTDGNVLDEYIPTAEEEQAILDAEDRLTYGNTETIDPNTIVGHARIIQARIRQQSRRPLPDEPPF